jgi:glycosyltransferase involved in cell wall biosynthesis
MGMKILFVSPFLPYPPVAGGHAQIWGWMTRLAAEHELAFAGFYEREREAAGAEQIAKLCAATRVRLRKPTPHAFVSFANVPLAVSELFSAELQADVADLHRSFRPDVVQFLSPHLAPYRRAIGETPTVVTALEIGFVAQARRIAAAAGFARWRARLEWTRMLAYETKLFRKANHVIAVSASDAQIVRAVAPRARVTAVPPGVDRELLAPRPRRPQPGTVLYVGHMEHSPNLDGLLFLYRDIWPRVRRARADAQLTVAGGGLREELARAAPEVLAAMEGDASVTLAGFIPDLRAQMEESAVMAAPLRLGGGVRNKVIEAMAVGLPVVATRRAAEGLSVHSGREVLLADDPEAFAARLVEVMGDAALQETLSAAGRELVAREHDNDALARRLAEALAEAVA